jgi:hypothetical protein
MLLSRDRVPEEIMLLRNMLPRNMLPRNMLLREPSRLGLRLARAAFRRRRVAQVLGRIWSSRLLAVRSARGR